jgi:hypothetical protein
MTYGFFLAALACLGPVAAGPERPPGLSPFPPAAWKVGDSWAILIDPPGEGADSGTATPAPVAMHVLVSGKVELRGEPHWKLDFLTPGRAGKPAGPDFRLFVRQEDGAPTLLVRGPTADERAVRVVGEVPLIWDPPAGVPLDLFFTPLTYRQTVFPDKASTLTVERSLTDDHVLVLEATYRPAGDAAPLVVRQTWAPGEKWWREFVRYRGGRKELSARIDPRSLTPAPARPPAGKTPGLRDDGRLAARLTAELHQPNLSAVVGRIGAAAGLDLSLEERLGEADPPLGSVSWKNAPAWQAMEDLAASLGPDAHWEPTEGGYRLHAPLPPSRLGVDRHRWFVALLGAGGFAVLASLIVWRGWRRSARGRTGQGPGESPGTAASPP